jgi:hypothetical protein
VATNANGPVVLNPPGRKQPHGDAKPDATKDQTENKSKTPNTGNHIGISNDRRNSLFLMFILQKQRMNRVFLKKCCASLQD